MPPEIVWIIGAGRFGRIALERLSDRESDRRFVVVDPAMEGVEPSKQIDCNFIREEGVAFLKENLVLGCEPDWIIPALPRHLAAEWCLAVLGSQGLRRTALPESLSNVLPNPIWGDTGDVYVSFADFLCPDDCPEPRDHCFATGKRRKTPMFDLLANLSVPGFTPLTIRSRQLAPGVGGYRPAQLFDLLENVRQAENDLILATACRCHGVLTGVRKTPAD